MNQVSESPLPSIAGLVVVVLGCMTSVFVLSSFLRFHAGNYKYKSHLGPCYLVFMSSFWTLSAALTFMSVLVYKDIVGGWCLFNGITITLSTSGNLFGHTLIAFERYFLVIQSRPMPWSFICGYSILNYALVFTCLFMQLFASRHGYTPMEDRLWCFFNWTETFIYDRIASVLVLIFAFSSLTIITHVYLAVYLKTRKVARKATAFKAKKSMSDLERQVFYRCCWMILSFVSFYSPVTLFFFYRFVTLQHISPWLDYTLAMWTLFDGIATPFLVCFMNVDFRDAVLAYLPKKWGRLFVRVTEYKNTTDGTQSTSQGTSLISTVNPIHITE